ncbi:unnamed protein product [Fraxinus pennsylvanica]|uniref:Uncharacterized protein n=1 Tax=Fraxinus pennsylvanica TaxID=56036 RepID=A0AAD2DZW5_9LAMI|nr:unnamed protein product [Fraxinus pennsylvanica]
MHSDTNRDDVCGGGSSAAPWKEIAGEIDPKIAMLLAPGFCCGSGGVSGDNGGGSSATAASRLLVAMVRLWGWCIVGVAAVVLPQWCWYCGGADSDGVFFWMGRYGAYVGGSGGFGVVGGFWWSGCNGVGLVVAATVRMVMVIVGTFLIDTKKDMTGGAKGDATASKFPSPIGGASVPGVSFRAPFDSPNQNVGGNQFMIQHRNMQFTPSDSMDWRGKTGHGALNSPENGDYEHIPE